VLVIIAKLLPNREYSRITHPLASRQWRILVLVVIVVVRHPHIQLVLPIDLFASVICRKPLKPFDKVVQLLKCNKPLLKLALSSNFIRTELCHLLSYLCQECGCAFNIWVMSGSFRGRDIRRNWLKTVTLVDGELHCKTRSAHKTEDCRNLMFDRVSCTPLRVPRPKRVVSTSFSKFGGLSSW
jgi:hypothetical protein